MNSAQFLTDFFKRFNPVPGKPVVVAVSGGADSLCLVHLLLASELQIIPVHYDHQLRPKSAEQAQQVLALMKSWGLEPFLGAGDVREIGRANKMGLEEAARNCRYGFLTNIAKEFDAQAILTAHHLDDQVETVLMHFLRGSGINGLSGMRPVEVLQQFSK
ncbi:MAG: tRNA lysidine(34) synthetase TilS, partial [Chloroflexi bacterium]|nr:tRNA lysidine(34) synthetase TilS [Chloroflexota bacterium]